MLNSCERRLWLGALVLLTVGAGTQSARAQTPLDPSRTLVPISDEVVLALPGEARLSYQTVSPIAVSPATDAQTEIPTEHALEARVRLQPALWASSNAWRPFHIYTLQADVDLVRDALAVGEGRDLLSYDPAEGRGQRGRIGPLVNEFYGQAIGHHLSVRAGLMRSSWGQGILANSGEDPAFSSQASPFGIARHSDRVLRALVAFTPYGLRPASALATSAAATGPPLTLAVAADLVVEDDTADLTDGDRAWQVLFAAFGSYDIFDGGIYTVFRTQGHAGGGTTTVGAIDVRARLDVVHTPQLSAWLETEMAAVIGETDYALSGSHAGPFDITTMGGVVRVAVDAGPALAVLEAGWSSPDDNPFDGHLRAFAFDREHRVGLLLFREALRAMTAVTAHNIADPELRGSPPRGFDRTATGGAVVGAAYINPRVTLELRDDLALNAGLLYATVPKSYTDPYRSGLVGGAPVGPNGAASQDDLGIELDLGVRYMPHVEGLQLDLRLELAYLAPGGALQRMDSTIDDIIGAWVSGGFRW